MGAGSRTRAPRAEAHPADCAACAANRAALLRNAIPTRVCEVQRRQLQQCQQTQPNRVPLREIVCPQQNAMIRADGNGNARARVGAKQQQQQVIQSAPYQAGLKAFTALVASKLIRFRSVQHTTLADMLVSEALQNYQQRPCFDSMTIDKNIRRRTYDTLNVFASMGIVIRSGKNVMWKGPQALLQQMEACSCKLKRHPHQLRQQQHAHTCDVSRVRVMKCNVQTRRRCIETKRTYLQTLQRHKQSLCALLARNLQTDSSRVRAGRYETCNDLTFRLPCHESSIEMPFIIVVCNTSSSTSTSSSSPPTSSCLVELSEDRLSVGLSFNVPFRVLHDYALVDLVMNKPERVNTTNVAR